jgi:hypothetical protein
MSGTIDDANVAVVARSAGTTFGIAGAEEPSVENAGKFAGFTAT